MIEIRTLDEMPKILRDQMTELEAWAEDNRKDSRRDAIRFWALKIPAVIISAGAGISSPISDWKLRRSLRVESQVYAYSLTASIPAVHYETVITRRFTI